MVKKIEVKQGDSVSRFAYQYGLAPDDIWDHPDNTELRTRRTNMDVLKPGDVLAIPEKRVKKVNVATGQRHKFRLRGVPMLFKIRLFDENGQPRKQRHYQLRVDGETHYGMTNDDGLVEKYIANTATKGRLIIEKELDQRINFGHLDPADTLTGIQQRLSNMGFPCTQDNGEMGQATKIAIVSFQRMCGFELSSELDSRTRHEIQQCYDSPERLMQHMKKSTVAG